MSRERLALWVGLLLLAVGTARAGVDGTRHDLSVSGPGKVKSASGREKCKFCHATHTGTGRQSLWSRRDNRKVFIRYESPSFDAAPGGRAPAPDGASRLCLSCHDGSVASGSHGPRQGDAPAIPQSSKANLGLDLSGTHPISFVYDDDLVARNNAKDLPLRRTADVRGKNVLDGRGKVQCTSCHDPHDDSNRRLSGAPFFRSADIAAMCAACHQF